MVKIGLGHPAAVWQGLRVLYCNGLQDKYPSLFKLERGLQCAWTLEWVALNILVVSYWIATWPVSLLWICCNLWNEHWTLMVMATADVTYWKRRWGLNDWKPEVYLVAFISLGERFHLMFHVWERVADIVWKSSLSPPKTFKIVKRATTLVVACRPSCMHLYNKFMKKVESPNSALDSIGTHVVQIYIYALKWTIHQYEGKIKPWAAFFEYILNLTFFYKHKVLWSFMQTKKILHINTMVIEIQNTYKFPLKLIYLVWYKAELPLWLWCL